MRKKLLLLPLLCLLSVPGLSAPARAAEMNMAALRQIVQAGGSLILDMEKENYSISELAALAASLKYNSTLTIKISAARPLTPAQCGQIAKANPGHVVFWF